jgi:hypothetical protein
VIRSRFLTSSFDTSFFLIFRCSFGVSRAALGVGAHIQNHSFSNILSKFAIFVEASQLDQQTQKLAVIVRQCGLLLLRIIISHLNSSSQERWVAADRNLEATMWWSPQAQM